jgi:hypothetical protein
LLGEAQEQHAAASALLAHAHASRALSETHRLTMQRAHHAFTTATDQAAVAHEHLTLLEEAIVSINEATSAEERSAALRQEALDGRRESAEAEESALQLKERLAYALKEAEEAERVAEERSGEGDLKCSMEATGAAARCTPLSTSS